MSEDKKVKHFELLKQRLGDFSQYEYFGGYEDIENKKKNNFMKNIEINEEIEYPEIEYKCKCGHGIKQNCYIRHKETKEIIIMGSCCIRKFEIKKFCFKCNKRHGRTKSTICIDCENEDKLKIKELKQQQKEKIKLENTIITFGMHKNKTIKHIYENNINYFNWCITKNKEEYNKIFKDIVRYNKLLNL